MSNSDLYDRKVSGKIKLKGISKLVKKKKKDSKDKTCDSESKTPKDSVKEFIGTGRIVSSGTTVQGFETKFVEESSVNDRIVIEHPLTHGTEERVIESIISNRTLSIDLPFSVDVITTIPYNIRKYPKDVDINESGNEYFVKMNKIHTSTVSVREKAGMWSYKNVTKTIKGEMSAEDRLNERVKLSRDKYCW